MECEDFFSRTGHHPTIQPRHVPRDDDDDYEGDPEEATEDASPHLGDEAGSLCQTRLE